MEDSVRNDTPRDRAQRRLSEGRQISTTIVDCASSLDTVGKEKSHRYIKGTTIAKPPTAHDDNAIWGIIFHPLNVLLIFLPLGTVAFYLKWSDEYTFWFNFLAMISLAKILGDATEELAASLKNDVIAGLLNATFGNAVEMVITLKTLRAGYYDVVKSTLLGSVLSNTLLVLGMSFLCGGLVTIRASPPPPRSDFRSFHRNSNRPSVNKRCSGTMQMDTEYKKLAAAKDNGQKLPAKTDSDNSKEMLSNIDHREQERLDVAAFVSNGPSEGASSYCPMDDTIVHLKGDAWDVGEKIQNFSVLGALVNTSMLLISCMSFSLITVFRTVSHKDNEEYMDEVLLPVSRIASVIIILAYVAYTFFQLVTHKETMAADQTDENDDGAEHLSAAKSCILLFATTVIVSCCTEMLVHAIQGVTEKSHISKHFIGIILLPIVGNACEHAAAVRFAMQDKLGLSVSIAVGSSTQIALFVVPFSVLAGWAIERPMDLNFGILSTTIITLSVIVVLSMVVDGSSNWLQGYLLCSVYGIVAVMYWYLPDDLHDSLNPS